MANVVANLDEYPCVTDAGFSGVNLTTANSDRVAGSTVRFWVMMRTPI
jgi:hypothetical protein